MELREERLDVDKRDVSGEVRATKDVVEEQKSIDVPLHREEAIHREASSLG